MDGSQVGRGMRCIPQSEIKGQTQNLFNTEFLSSRCASGFHTAIKIQGALPVCRRSSKQ